MAKIQAVWAIDIGQAALKALKLVPGRRPRPGRGRGVRLRRAPQDPQPARRRPRRAHPRGAREVPLPQRPEGRHGRHRRARARPAWPSSSSCRRSRRRRSPTSSSSRPSSRSPSRSTRSSGTTRRSAARARSTTTTSRWNRDRPVRHEARPDQPRHPAASRTSGSRSTSSRWPRSPCATSSPTTCCKRPSEPAKGSVVAARHRHRQHQPDHHRRRPDLAAARPARRQPLHPRPDQGTEAHLRQGRAPEAERHQGPRPPRRPQGDARRLQRLRRRGPALARLLHEHQPHGQDRQGRRPGQRLQAARPAEVPPAEAQLRGREARELRPAGRRRGHRRAAVPGEPAVVRRRLRPGAAGAGHRRGCGRTCCRPRSSRSG